MRRLHKAILVLMVLVTAAFIAGCAEKEVEEPDTPPPPPPPSPQEIAAKIVGELQLDAPLPGPGSRMKKETSNNLQRAITTANAEHSATSDGKRALQIVSQKLDARLRALESNQLWEHVMAYSDAYAILNPGTHKWDGARQTAAAELQKPSVAIKGFYIDGNTGQTAVFLDFYLPAEKETHREQVRAGEEFYGLKLVQIIGNNKGVTMEYLQTGQTFDILTSKARK